MEVNISLSGNPQEIAEVTGLFKDMKAEVQKLNSSIESLKVSCQHLSLDQQFFSKELGKLKYRFENGTEPSGEIEALLINEETGEAKLTKVKFEKETSAKKR